MTGHPSDEVPERGVGRPTKYDPSYCELVLEEMGKGFSLTAFAGILGVSRATIDLWMKANPEFMEAVSRGKAMRLVHWERAAMKVAERGGGPGTATVIVFGLKNMGGDDWSDKTHTEISGTIGVRRIERVIIRPPDSDT